MALFGNNAFQAVATTNRYERKETLARVYQTAKIWDIHHATHMLDVLLFANVISTKAYSSILQFLRKQIEQGWY